MALSSASVPAGFVNPGLSSHVEAAPRNRKGCLWPLFGFPFLGLRLKLGIIKGYDLRSSVRERFTS